MSLILNATIMQLIDAIVAAARQVPVNARRPHLFLRYFLYKKWGCVRFAPCHSQTAQVLAPFGHRRSWFFQKVCHCKQQAPTFKDILVGVCQANSICYHNPVHHVFGCSVAHLLLSSSWHPGTHSCVPLDPAAGGGLTLRTNGEALLALHHMFVWHCSRLHDLCTLVLPFGSCLPTHPFLKPGSIRWPDCPRAGVRLSDL